MKPSANFIWFCCLLLLACSKSDDSEIQVDMSSDEIIAKKILFIGNSHTQYNGGLDLHLRGFTSDAEIPTLITAQAISGFTLEDHLNLPATLDLIASEAWDIIVLQENTSRAAYEPSEMLESIEAFKTLFGQSGSEVYLFQTWAYENIPEMNALLTNVYNQAVTTSGFKLLSVGSLWVQFHSQQSLSLYNDDGVHPNLLGTYLNAAIFYKKFFGATDLDTVNYNATLDLEQATIVKTFVSSLSL